MAGEGVPAEVGAVLPFGGLGVARARVLGVQVLDLVLEGKAFVHWMRGYLIKV